jgi:hypothetical protein
LLTACIYRHKYAIDNYHFCYRYSNRDCPFCTLVICKSFTDLFSISCFFTSDYECTIGLISFIFTFLISIVIKWIILSIIKSIYLTFGCSYEWFYDSLISLLNVIPFCWRHSTSYRTLYYLSFLWFLHEHDLLFDLSSVSFNSEFSWTFEEIRHAHTRYNFKVLTEDQLMRFNICVSTERTEPSIILRRG